MITEENFYARIFCRQGHYNQQKGFPNYFYRHRRPVFKYNPGDYYYWKHRNTGKKHPQNGKGHGKPGYTPGGGGGVTPAVQPPPTPTPDIEVDYEETFTTLFPNAGGPEFENNFGDGQIDVRFTRPTPTPFFRTPERRGRQTQEVI